MTFFSEYNTYKKDHIKQKLAIILPAFLLALGINTLLFTDVGHRAQSSIIQYDGAIGPQISTSITDTLTGEIHIHENISEAEAIHLTLLYDPQAIELQNIQTSIAGAQVLQMSNTSPHILKVLLPQSTQIQPNTSILTYEIAKLTKEARNINLTETFIEKENERFPLSAKGSKPF